MVGLAAPTRSIRSPVVTTTDRYFQLAVVDDRLAVHESVIGVEVDGMSIAFPVAAAESALDRGEDVELGGVSLQLVSGGVIAVDSATGEQLPSHQSFWFAWSQFRDDTLLWVG